MRTNLLSKNVISIMEELAKIDGLVDLIINDTKDPFNSPRPKDFYNRRLIKPRDEYCRILPVPFNPETEAEVTDRSTIRVYYNQGEFDAEIISETTLFIDIIVAKSLWLISDTRKDEALIRPYEILDRVIDTIGRKSGNPIITVNFTGWQHLAVNTKFDAIRLYAEYFKPEM